jgi:hypothetical protein
MMLFVTDALALCAGLFRRLGFGRGCFRSLSFYFRFPLRRDLGLGRRPGDRRLGDRRFGGHFRGGSFRFLVYVLHCSPPANDDYLASLG